MSAPAHPTMKLLNCRRCDDVVKLVENKERSCECGSTRGKLQPEVTRNGTVFAERVLITGAERVLEISWEAYDGIAEGEVRDFGILPRKRY